MCSILNKQLHFIILHVQMKKSTYTYQKGEIAVEILPFIRTYRDGRVERLAGTQTTSPKLDPETGVNSKDIKISEENDILARLYIPNIMESQKRIPVLIYFHGGGFCIQTPFSPTYHNYLNALASKADVLVVSVNYRKAPEHPLPTGYEDSWESLQWVASHSTFHGPEAWLNDHANFRRVFLAGDSSGANIAHHMAIRSGFQELVGLKFTGMILVHPLFLGNEAIGNEVKRMDKKRRLDKLWFFVCPTTSGCDDPYINPVADLTKLTKLSCARVLVFAAEQDVLRDRSWFYYEGLKKSGWEGEAEIMEAYGEDHVFHLFRPSCANADIMMKKIVSFIIEEKKKPLHNKKGVSCL